MPGVCYRLWTKQDELSHPAFTLAEILIADLAPLALELAQWGTPKAEGLLFPDLPPQAHLSQAQSVLFMLGALDRSGKLTHFGRRMARLSVHPRLSAMILHAADKGLGAKACLLASLLEEKDNSLMQRDIDLQDRWYLLNSPPKDHRSTIIIKRITEHAERLKKLTDLPDRNLQQDISETDHLGILLALAFPERIAKKRSGTQYQLAQGTIVSLPEDSRLIKEEFLAIGDVDAASAVGSRYDRCGFSDFQVMPEELFRKRGRRFYYL
jgi:ATP-dependent helicase HrpB